MRSFSVYSEKWPKEFKKESLKLEKVLQDKVLNIQHIGSTAIPNLSAKPIIDIAVLTDSIENIQWFVIQVANLEYVYNPDMSSNERIFFRKGNPIKYHLSITSPKFTFWERNIIFRDRLRKYPKLAKEYENLKIRNFSETSSKDREDLSKSVTYNNGKGDFVYKILHL